MENKVLRSKIKGRIQFTDDERRPLVDAALAMGRKLMESVVNIVKPATLLPGSDVWKSRSGITQTEESESREDQERLEILRP